MAYKAQSTIHNIKFEDPHSLAGLEIKSRATNMKDFAFFVKHLAKVGEFGKEADGKLPKEAAELTQQASNSLDMVKEKFAEKLVDWNLELDDVPVSPDIFGISLLEDELFLKVINAWMEAIGGTPDPLERNLTSGESFPDLSLPMESRLLSLPN